jgi:hypothetical protein
MGYIDTENSAVVPCIYDEVANIFLNGLAWVEQKGKYGFINKIGKIEIPLIYEHVGKANFSDEFASVQLNDKWGYVDRKGNQIIPCVYDEAHNFSENLALVKQYDKWGYIDRTGKCAIPFIYDLYMLNHIDYSQFSFGIAAVKLNGKEGYINKEGLQYWED